MIYDKLEHIMKYESLSKWFAIACEYLKKTDLNTLPYGVHEIQGKHVFIHVMEAETRMSDEIEYEIHKRYMDIQICLKGNERIEIGIDPILETQQYEKEKDYGTIQCKNYMSFPMSPNTFIVCMKEEAHKATLACEKKEFVKKAVIKVEIDGNSEVI